MTIEDIFIKGEISILIRNICMANEIKTLGDLKLHYHDIKGFKNLLYCDEKSNNELIAIYNKYKDVYIEEVTSKSVSENKNEPKLEDVVTDYDEVTKTTHTAGVLFEEIEQRLKNHWREEANKKTSQIDRPEFFEKATLDVYSADYKKIEHKPKDYLRNRIIEIADKKAAKNKSTFGRHPSKKLNALYAVKSYQGANPVDAKVIFVGRDPNWAANIEETDMFGSVVEYLTDGISFWERYAIHHPFLLKSYRGDGQRYHRVFSKMNLDSSVASKISFVELIGFPTTGMAGSNAKSFREYLFSDENRDNLRLLDKVLNDPSKIIFIAWGLMNDFKLIYERTGLFERFAKLDKSKMNITDLNEYENIFVHRHLSDAISNATIKEIEKKVKSYLK